MINYQAPASVHWPTVLKEIRSACAGLTCERVAGITGLAKSTVYAIQSGHSPDPRHSTAARILALHDSVVNK